MLEYHVTSKRDWKRIKESGYIKATIGPRSAIVGEQEARIYLFDDMGELDDCVGNWLCEYYPRKEPLEYLTIKLNDHDKKLVKNTGFDESYYYGNIPVKDVIYVTEDDGDDGIADGGRFNKYNW